MDRTTLGGLLANRILVLDGAMGTMIQRLHLGEADFRGERFRHVSRDVKDDNDLLALTRPAVIAGIHDDYLAAGSDIITTNTFNSTAISQARYGLGSIAFELNVAASRLAREACARWTARTPGKPRLVAGSIGPLPLATFDALKAAYKEQVRGLIEGGCDLLLVETIIDALNAGAAIAAIDEVHMERRCGAGEDQRVPLMLSVTVSRLGGRLPSGQTLEAFWASVAAASPLSVGINCAFGARAMPADVAALAQIADCCISCHPSAGLPDPDGGYGERPADTAGVLAALAADGLLNIVGGCCGTTPEHVRAIAGTVKGMAPRVVRQVEQGLSSGS